MLGGVSGYGISISSSLCLQSSIFSEEQEEGLQLSEDERFGVREGEIVKSSSWTMGETKNSGNRVRQ